MLGKRGAPAALLKLLHFDAASNDESGPLVDVVRLDVENAALPVGCKATRLLRNERERIGFVEQSQFAVRISTCGRIEEDTAFEHGAMKSATSDPT